MAYPLEFLRLVAIGTLYGTETFSYSMSLIHAGGTTPNAPDEVPVEIIDAFAEFHATALLISQNAALTTLKLNLIGTDGRYVNPETVLYDYPVPVQGAVGGGPPPQIAMAVSLGTAAQRGRASRGRFYAPLPAAQVSVGAIISDTSQGLWGAAAATLLDEINAALVPWTVGVVSDLGAGAQRPVTHVRIGRALDTIRSRRSSLDETYEEYPLGV